MHSAQKALAASFLLLAGAALPSFAQKAPLGLNPNGSFVDTYGTAFRFNLCGKSGTDLCGVLTNLEGKSATTENLAYVGKLVMRAAQNAPNQWKGALMVGDRHAEVTVTMVGRDAIEIQGCQAVIFCQTLAYYRS